MVKVQKSKPKSFEYNSVQANSNNPIIKSKIKQCKKSSLKRSPIAIHKEKKLYDDSKKSFVLQKNNVKEKKVLNKQVVSAQPEIVAVIEEKRNQKKNIVENKSKHHNTVASIETQVVDSLVDKNQKRRIAVKSGLKNKKKDTIQFETVPFDEQKLNAILTLKNIEKIVNALKLLVEKEVAEKKTSIFSDYRYFLNISCYKIPNCPKRIVKLNLKHSLVDTNTDNVVIIVPDLQRGAKMDYEPTIQRYEDLFREIGITNIKIVPFNQLRNECTTFETKRKFANTYDYFLCDGRIVSHVVGFCGKNFQKPRTTIHAVRLDNPKTYKSDIAHALNRTSYKQIEKGDLISIPVGNHRFTDNLLTENIKLVVEQLKNCFPGGYANIRNIHIKIDIKGTSSIPLYVNLAGAPLETPHVIGLREQRMLELKKEANDILFEFSISKTGDIVKLNKAQMNRKREIRRARESLLSEENLDSNDKNKAITASKKGRKEIKKELTKQIKNYDHEESEDGYGKDYDISDIAEDKDDNDSSDC